MFQQADKIPNGNWVIVYTMGMAMLYLPFFLIGHLWAIAGGYPTDGYSFPYQFCVSTGMMIYIVLGIIIFRKLLLRYFSDKVTAVVLFLFCLGTNYFREATDYNMGPHATLFMFYCLLIYYTIKWHQIPKVKYAVVIGVSLGFISLIRPSEVICILIPLFWNVNNKQALMDKITMVKQYWKHLLVLFFACFIVGIPQMMYWKTVAGSWFFNSYWNHPSFTIESHVMNIFFSFRKGWFLYTPMIAFAFIGFYFLYKYKLFKSTPVVVSFIILNIFIISHNPVWWNAGSLGQRFMVQSYVILAFPFGAFIQYVYEKKLMFKLFISTIFGLFVLLNIFQTWQLTNWIIPGDGITEEYYKRMFLKTKTTPEDERWLLHSEYGDVKDALVQGIKYDKVYSCSLDIDGGSTMLNADNVFSKPILTPTNLGYDVADNYLVASAIIDTNAANISTDLSAHLVTVINKNGKLFQYRQHDFNYNDVKTNNGNIQLSVLVPPQVSDGHYELSSYVYIDGKCKMKLLNLTVSVLKEGK